MASTGFNFNALRAGNIDDSIPVATTISVTPKKKEASISG